MNKVIVTLILLSCCIFNAEAQTDGFPRNSKQNQRYWLLGFGISGQSMYDEAASFVRYNGSGIGPSLGLIKTSEKRYRQFKLEPTFNKLTTNRGNGLRPMEVKTTRFVLDYQYLLKVKQWNEKLKLYAGGDASFLFNLKRAEQLDNSQLFYDYALSIGPAAKLDKDFTWRKRNCTLSYNLGIPLISQIARPYYLNRIEFIDPKNNFVGDLFKNSSIVSVNKLIRVTSEVSLTYPLFNHNALQISYRWDFYKMKTINAVYAAEHLISFTFMSNY